MSDHTGIEWTDATWNPIRGCTRVSEGCRHCYAERVAARFSGPDMPYEGLAIMRDGEPRWTGHVRVIEDHLGDPLRWTKPRRIFVNSMSDLFHEKLPDLAIDVIFAVMARAPHHTFQILTKRPARMLEYFGSGTSQRVWDRAGHPTSTPWPLPNVWLGVSAENQATANERIPLLVDTPAAMRFVSAEPLLGRIELDDGWEELDWIIVGGESGPGARPMHPRWARSLRDQCLDAGIAFFFKQWGEWAPLAPQYEDDSVEGEREITEVDQLFDVEMIALQPDGDIPQGVRPNFCHYQPGRGTHWMERAGKKRAGRQLDGREWNEFPHAH